MNYLAATMRKISLKKPRPFKSLNAPYRLVIINDQSLEEVATFRMTKYSVYGMLSTAFIVIILVTVLILLFTPLRFYIPGYGSSADRDQVIKLRSDVDSISRLAHLRQVQAENIRQVLIGENPTPLDTTKLDPNVVEREARESILPAPEVVQQEAAKAMQQEAVKKKK